MLAAILTRLRKLRSPWESGDEPRFTIIIPTLNPGAKLRRSVDSILSQQDIPCEVLIVDGGSTDGTATRWAECPETVRWISAPGSGVYEAMNRGVQEARGQILYFLGAGDRLRPAALSTVTADWPQQKYVMLYGDVWMEDLDLRYDGEFTKAKLGKKNICHQGIFYSRQVFAKHGQYEQCYPILADYALNLRVFGDDAVKKIYLPCVLADYEGDGLSAHNRDEAFESSKAALCHQYLGIAPKPARV